METVTHKRLVSFGELMLRLDTPSGQRLQESSGFKKYFGGAEANTCVLLSQMGLPGRYITALPDNALGLSALQALQKYGVDTSFIQRDHNRIGLYFTEHGNNVRPSRVIYDRKYSSFASLKPGSIHWKSALEGAGCLYWTGITPALSRQSADLCLEGLLVAKEAGIPIAADMNYRSTLWDYGQSPDEVMPGLLSHCEIITGDVDTAEVYFGIKTFRDLSWEDQFGHCVEELKKKLPQIKTLAMSFRKTSSSNHLLYSGGLYHRNQVYFAPAYSINPVIDRFGSGDAFQAGLLYGLLKEMNGQDIVQLATSCGIIKHSMEGDFTIVSPEDIRHFLEHGPANRIIR